MTEHHIWIGQRLSIVQREVLRALAEGRVPYDITVSTMQALVRRNLVADVNGAPKVTELGQNVVRDMPGGR